MPPQQLLQALIDRLPAALRAGPGGEEGLTPELARRVREDAEARELWTRLLRQARALSTLERRPVPSDLEGRVVASLHAGHRQRRVAERLDRLGRVAAPAELTARVRRLAERPYARVAAPSVLDRLVEFELDDGQRAGSRAGSRWSRTWAILARGPARGRAPRAAAALAAVLLVGAAWWVLPRPGVQAPRPSIEIHVVTDPAQAPLLAGFVDTLSGGGLGGAQ